MLDYLIRAFFVSLDTKETFLYNKMVISVFFGTGSSIRVVVVVVCLMRPMGLDMMVINCPHITMDTAI